MTPFPWDDEPLPPYPESSFIIIGEFFFLFSIVERWVHEYIKVHGGSACEYTSDFSRNIDRWQQIALRIEPDHTRVQQFSCELRKLLDERHALAHAWWQQYSGQLHGIHYRRRDRRRILIDGNEDLQSMLRRVKYCEAVIDFWSS
jgi:hypothetical protein